MPSDKKWRLLRHIAFIKKYDDELENGQTIVLPLKEFLIQIGGI